MKRRWLAVIVMLILLAGAGLWLTGAGSSANAPRPERSQSTPLATWVVRATPGATVATTPTPSPVARTTKSLASAPTASPASTPTRAPSLAIARASPAPAKPLRLLIPKLGVNAAIESVGLAANGNMDVPSTWESVGWYDNGPKPGGIGNAVIDGHLDSYTGPAVFWHLRDLKPGDSVQVKAADGAVLHFVVTGSQSFDANDFPSKRVFGPATQPQLNLITCDGSWDQSQSQYDQRLVVFTSLAGSNQRYPSGGTGRLDLQLLNLRVRTIGSRPASGGAGRVLRRHLPSPGRFPVQLVD